MNEERIKELALKHALKNAYDHGKAILGGVVGKVIAEYPESKKNMKKTMDIINKVIEEVNSLSQEEIKKRMASFEYAKKEEKERHFFLPDAEKGNVKTRFAPEPSGYLHIGHAKAVFIEYLSAKEYNGKMLLRFDDTNPEKESQEYVDAILEDLKYLKVIPDEQSFSSDKIPILYNFAEELISKGFAYVSLSSREELKKMRDSKGKKEIPDRKRNPEENMKLWKDMLNGRFKEGQAVLLLKGDLASNNTAMRDPTLFRIIEKPHYRQKNKFIVWPAYDFAAPILDSIEGITHAMRSKEYELRDEVYYYILDKLNLRKPKIISFSRLSIKNAPVSKRLITPLVREGKVEGWDDPRLPTIRGLRRRGILPEAIKNFVISFGLGKTESNPGWEKLLAENRKLLDKTARHFFFVSDPILLEIKKGINKILKLRAHPKEDLGYRLLSVSDSVYISEKDASSLKENDVFRLKDFCNVRLIKKEQNKLLAEFISEEGLVDKKIQWVPTDSLRCILLIPKDLLKEDGSFNEESMKTEEGLCEPSCRDLTVGDIIQFERVGFVRLDKKEPMTFIFSC